MTRADDFMIRYLKTMDAVKELQTLADYLEKFKNPTVG